LRNHRTEECKREYDPDSDPTLNGVKTEVCEQTNAWLKEFQSTVRQMNPDRFKVFMLYMCHLKNKQLAKNCAPGAPNHLDEEGLSVRSFPSLKFLKSSKLGLSTLKCSKSGELRLSTLNFSKSGELRLLTLKCSKSGGLRLPTLNFSKSGELSLLTLKCSKSGGLRLSTLNVPKRRAKSFF